ncbi:SPOR domain-containing protein [Ferrimonas lipolytica]|uniref:Sporulation protein n=1 Tax=Ferrimonas lipolytica TaxID=2724191 RepID=A0A6H1UFZ0_9GAMM|nr:SPOR domain-containing protein [Ferrimonas lipolytica]QIZ77964.1 sporulation protein [Ferrimonas lipolytica]
MAKDYAGNRSTGRRGAKPRRGKQPAKKPFPWVIALTAALLVSLFGYGLLSIQGASEQTAAEDVVEAEPKKAKPKPQKPLPEAPEKNRWEYEKALPEKTVEIDVEQQKSAGPYQMQCGSFRTQDQADRMKATIALSAGHESQVRRTTGKNGVWFRVVLGPIDSKRTGEAMRHDIQRAGINGCQMWKWTD